MQEKGQNSISITAADKLIAAHDGNVALVYIWLCRCGAFNAERAARELCLTLAEVNSAYEKLCRMELFAEKEVQKSIPLPAEELPQYTTEDIVRRTDADPGFKAVLNEAQQKLGRVLSTSDIKTLFGIYDFLALPAGCHFHAADLLHRHLCGKIRQRQAALDAQHRKGGVFVGETRRYSRSSRPRSI